MYFGNLYISFITGLIRPFYSEDTLIGNILIGEYGVLTMTVTFLIGALLPLVAGFYFLTHVLEDSNLLPRIAHLLDRPARRLGLSGGAIIPFLLGFGCVTVALVSVDLLQTRRERLIASVLLSLVIPCSAQVAIIFAFMLLLDVKYIVIYFAVIILVFILVGMVLNGLLPGKVRPLSIDLNPVKLPNFKEIIIRTALEARNFLRESGLPFFVGSIVISLLDYYNVFMKLAQWFSPITSGFLKLPDTATNLFVMSIIKRDLGAAAFYSLVNNGSFTQPQIVVTLTVLTLFVPCFASQMILFKQGRPLTAILIWISSFLMAFSVGGLVSFMII
ncbi:MAG: nucleoside recognition domain-containing protein [Anaerovoracaceae bacterium]|jgi:ferrous iron transport protein B